MAFRKVEKKDFIYFFYSREQHEDLDRFRLELGNLACTLGCIKDVVVDFSGASTVSSAEISILIRVLKSMFDTGRTLRLITPPHIERLISATNITKLKNIQLYESLETLCAQMR